MGIKLKEDNESTLQRNSQLFETEELEKTEGSSNIEDLFGYFYGLKEEILKKGTELQDYLKSPALDKELQQYLGILHGFLDDVDSFLKSLSIIEGKVKGALITEDVVKTSEEIKSAKKKIAQVSGEEDKEEELDKKFKYDGPIKPGDRITTLPPLDRSKTVGSQYDPVFLVEEILRSTGGYVCNHKGIYSDVQTAFDEIIKKDPNISAKQKEKVVQLLAKEGHIVKA
ncbi:MAG TPA: hypothetical protein P5513_05430 [Candidatus Diapherotrites archaeon]|nr:hypothetical protein [Candidatus Diapherotrites archaeon]